MPKIEIHVEEFVSQVSVEENSNLGIRISTREFDADGTQRGPDKFHRYVLEPWMDISKEDPRIKALASAVWTKDVVADAVAAIKKRQKDDAAMIEVDALKAKK